MKLVVVLLFLALAIVCVGRENGNKAKSFKPGGLWMDDNGMHINAHGGGVLRVGKTWYWFGEHKVEGSLGNSAQVGVHCYSSRDLYNWKDEGIALRVVTDNPGHDITQGCILERPKVIYNKKTKKYVMWFHLEPKGKGYSGALSGVAVSDRVTGPYTYLRAMRPNAGYWPLNVLPAHKKEGVKTGDKQFDGGKLSDDSGELNLLGRDFAGGQMARDMTLFVDDDGVAYHIYASEENSTLQISQLTDDYLGCSGKYARFFEKRFMEAPAMFKKDGKYYLIMSGCSGWAPNAARSAVADSPWGPWKELGNPCRGKGADKTFETQSTYVLEIGKGRFVYMGDRWTPKNAIDGRYIWLPLKFDGEKPILEWQDEWNLSWFNNCK